MTDPVTPTPSIGRILWYYPPGHPAGAQPHAAQVAFVQDDTTVNLGVVDDTGHPYTAVGVSLFHPDAVPADVAAAGNYVTWMPYQVGAVS